jgi:hypothetical protein
MKTSSGEDEHRDLLAQRDASNSLNNRDTIDGLPKQGNNPREAIPPRDSIKAAKPTKYSWIVLILIILIAIGNQW